MTFTTAQALDIGAAFAFVLLGTTVLASRGRHAPAAAFAALVIGLAGTYAQRAEIMVGGQALVPMWVGTLGWALQAAGTIGLLLLVPARSTIAEWPRWLGAVAFGAAVATGLSFWYWPTVHPGQGLAPLVGRFMGQASAGAAIVMFALRARRLPAEAHAAARSLALLGIGFGLLIAGFASTLVNAARGTLPLPVATVLVPALLVFPVILWLIAVRGPHARLHRNVVLGLVAINVGALLVATRDPTLAYPVARVVGVLVLGYAVVRGQIEGLDLKVRFAISKSTVAGVFIAVFFIASEAAQEFFGEAFESGYLGILAAGCLVFAIAPLSRVADRIAERAVPRSSPNAGPTAGVSEGEDAYRRAVRLALRDRQLSRAEERDLFQLASVLGLQAGRAYEIMAEVEEQVRVVK